MKYDYALSREAERYFRRLDPRRQAQVFELLEHLCLNPRDALISKPLHGEWQGCRSSRIGNLRIIYEVAEQLLLVRVLRLGPRGDVYKD